jgi:hypothetical protein
LEFPDARIDVGGVALQLEVPACSASSPMRILDSSLDLPV